MSNPEISINVVGNYHEYGAGIFARFLSEKYTADIIKESWLNIVSGTEPIDPLVAIDNVLKLKGSNLSAAFKLFTVWNYFTSKRANPSKYYEEGALYPFVKNTQIYPSMTQVNQHYVKEAPTKIGTESEPYDIPWEKGNFPEGNDIALPYLSAHYIEFQHPYELDKTSAVQINFDGLRSNWALNLIKTQLDETIVPVELTLDSKKQCYEKIANFGAHGDTTYSAIGIAALVVANNSITGREKSYKFAEAVCPVFKSVYTPSSNGTTMTVKSDCDDNFFESGDIVQFQVTLSSPVHIGKFVDGDVIPIDKRTLTADFSNVDAQFDPNNVIVWLISGASYRIRYILKDYIINDKPVIIKAFDLSKANFSSVNFYMGATVNICLYLPDGSSYGSVTARRIFANGSQIMANKGVVKETNNTGLDTTYVIIFMTYDWPYRGVIVPFHNHYDTSGAFVYGRGIKWFLKVGYVQTSAIKNIKFYTLLSDGEIPVSAHICSASGWVNWDQSNSVLYNLQPMITGIDSIWNEPYQQYERYYINYVELPSSISSSTSQMEIYSKADTIIKEAMIDSGLNLNIYPNPTKDAFYMQFFLNTAGHVKVNIYNITGQLINEIVNENKSAGIHTIKWDGKDIEGNAVPTGVYLYRINTSKEIKTGRFLIIK